MDPLSPATFTLEIGERSLKKGRDVLLSNSITTTLDRIAKEKCQKLEELPGYGSPTFPIALTLHLGLALISSC